MRKLQLSCPRLKRSQHKRRDTYLNPQNSHNKTCWSTIRFDHATWTDGISISFDQTAVIKRLTQIVASGTIDERDLFADSTGWDQLDKRDRAFTFRISSSALSKLGHSLSYGTRRFSDCSCHSSLHNAWRLRHRCRPKSCQIVWKFDQTYYQCLVSYQWWVRLRLASRATSSGRSELAWHIGRSALLWASTDAG